MSQLCSGCSHWEFLLQNICFERMWQRSPLSLTETLFSTITGFLSLFLKFLDLCIKHSLFLLSLVTGFFEDFTWECRIRDNYYFGSAVSKSKLRLIKDGCHMLPGVRRENLVAVMNAGTLLWNTMHLPWCTTEYTTTF